MAQSLLEALKTLSKQAEIGIELVKQYREQVNAGAAKRVFNAMEHKKEIWKAYNEVMVRFVGLRFGELSTIGTSEMWANMKMRGHPIRVTGTKKGFTIEKSNEGNADYFGLASDHLINQIFKALKSDSSISPGFRSLLEIAEENQISYDWEFKYQHYYKIPFRSKNVSYPRFLDDLLKGDVPYVYDPSIYVAYGAHAMGLLGMTPAEREALDLAAKKVFVRIIGAASKNKRG